MGERTSSHKMNRIEYKIPLIMLRSLFISKQKLHTLKTTALIIPLLCLGIFSCNEAILSDEEMLPETSEIEGESNPYVGQYQMELDHQKLDPVFDEQGNITAYTYVNYPVSDTVSISPIEEKPGKFQIDAIIKDAIKISVEGTIRSDTLFFEFNQSTDIRNNFVRGHFWLTSDFLFVNYTWDHSDTWSSSALPNNGYVKGLGTKLNL